MIGRMMLSWLFAATLGPVAWAQPLPVTRLDQVYHVRQYGILADGTDQTAAIQAALQAVYDGGGGTLEFGPGTYRIDGQLTIPNDGGTTFPPGPFIRPIIIRGAGGFTSGWVPGAPNGGTVLKFTSAQSPARIVTIGAGTLTLADLVLSSDGASGSSPFVLTTSTTLRINRVGFFGRQSTPANCDEDAIVCGGASVTGVTQGADTDPFQGYGTVIENCGFMRIRRALYGRTYANAIVFQNNWIRHDCGGEAAVEFESYHASEHCTGNVIAHNQVEMVGYRHFAKLTKGAFNHFISNSLWDFAYTGFTGCSYNAGTNTLTKTGAFAGVVAGESVYVVSGTGVTAGVYTIQTVIDNDNVVLTTDPTASSPSDLSIRVYVARAGVYSFNTSVLSTFMLDAVMSEFVPYVDSGATFAYNRLAPYSGNAAVKSYFTNACQFNFNGESGGVETRNSSGYGPQVYNTTWNKSHYFKQENNQLDLWFRFDATTLMHFFTWIYPGGNNVKASFGARASTAGTISNDGGGDLNLQVNSGKVLRLGTTGNMLALTPGTLAAAGTNQATAAQITEMFTRVTGATGTEGVKLPAAAAGLMCVVRNAAGANLLLYPASGDKLNGGLADAAITVTANTGVLVVCYDGTDCYTVP